MAEMDTRLFQALADLEMAEREDHSGGDRFFVRQTARAALQLAQSAGAQKPLCGEIIGRATRLLEGRPSVNFEVNERM